jgi:hypothetical protein
VTTKPREMLFVKEQTEQVFKMEKCNVKKFSNVQVVQEYGINIYNRLYFRRVRK